MLNIPYHQHYKIYLPNKFNTNHMSLSIFYRNGVKDETENEMGISYLTDAYIFNAICEECNINDAIAETYCFYSEIKLSFPCRQFGEVTQKCKQILFGNVFDTDYLLAIQQSLSEETFEDNVTIDDIFKCFYFNSVRFKHNIKGTADTIKQLSTERVHQWMRHYITSSTVLMYSNGKKTASENDKALLMRKNKNVNLPERYCNRTTDDVLEICTSKDEVDTICAFDVPYTFWNNLITVEKACAILEKRLNKACKKSYVEPIRVKLDIQSGFPCVIITSTIKKYNSEEFSTTLENILFAQKEPSHMEEEFAEMTIRKQYDKLKTNSNEMCSFIGLNFASGNLFNLEKMFFGQNNSTYEKCGNTFLTIFSRQNYSKVEFCFTKK